jgi:hypothetical protein
MDRSLDMPDLEFLLENEYGKHYLDAEGKIVSVPNDDALEFLTPKEACQYCIELIEAYQIKKFGHLL